MQLADKLPLLITNDHYWLELLKKDFHFSVEEAQYLKEQMRGSYEDVYKFCEADSFEIFDKVIRYSVFHNYTMEVELIDEKLKKLDDRILYELFDHLSLLQGRMEYTPSRHLTLFSDEEMLLLRRMNESKFEFSIATMMDSPRIKLMKSVKSPEIVFCLKGRLWLRLEHAYYLINNDLISKNKLDCISDIFNYRHQFSHFQNEQNQLHKKELFIQSVDEDTYEITKNILDFEINDLTVIQVKACMVLKGLGLNFSINELRNESWFDSDDHIKALEYLMENKKYTFTDALAFLRSMKGSQIEAVMDQISLDQLRICTNEYQVKAYIKFKSQGLTIERISQLHWFKNRYFFQSLCILIKYFDIDQSLSLLEKNPNLAYCANLEQCLTLSESHSLDQIVEIALQLNAAQIECLMNKIDIKEIIGLNEVQANALCSLFDRGLRGKHLRGQDWFSCPYHKDVLCYLVRKYNLSVDNALEVIKQTSWLVIVKIMKKLCGLDLSALNHFHIIALLKLEHLGLKREQLIGHAWFNNLKIKDELVYLMSHEKKSAEEALVFLQQKVQQRYVPIEFKINCTRLA